MIPNGPESQKPQTPEGDMKLSREELEQIVNDYVCPPGKENSLSTFRAFQELEKRGKVDHDSVKLLGEMFLKKGFCSKDELHLPSPDAPGTHEHKDTLLNDEPAPTKPVDSAVVIPPVHHKHPHRPISYGFDNE